MLKINENILLSYLQVIKFILYFDALIKTNKKNKKLYSQLNKKTMVEETTAAATAAAPTAQEVAAEALVLGGPVTVDNIKAESLSPDQLNIALSMADSLDSAEVVMSAKPESYSFKAVGETIRGVFVGFMPITVTDPRSETGYTDLPAIIWVDKDKNQKFCASTDLVRDFYKLGIKVNTPVEIIFAETVKTKNGNNVYKFKINLLGAPAAKA
jgi:hypothetical protein